MVRAQGFQDVTCAGESGVVSYRGVHSYAPPRLTGAHDPATRTAVGLAGTFSRLVGTTFGLTKTISRLTETVSGGTGTISGLA